MSDSWMSAGSAVGLSCSDSRESNHAALIEYLGFGNRQDAIDAPAASHRVERQEGTGRCLIVGCQQVRRWGCLADNAGVI